MNYQLHYERLIERARVREIGGYSERHHIIPKCMGGSDDELNIVRLYPEEHFVAHQLLVKIYPDSKGLLGAAFMMGSKSHKLRRHKAGRLKRVDIGFGCGVCMIGLVA